eukprot:6178748-Pleurochrysis_carterae.AAC.1
MPLNRGAHHAILRIAVLLASRIVMATPVQVARDDSDGTRNGERLLLTQRVDTLSHLRVQFEMDADAQTRLTKAVEHRPQREKLHVLRAVFAVVTYLDEAVESMLEGRLHLLGCLDVSGAPLQETAVAAEDLVTRVLRHLAKAL